MPSEPGTLEQLAALMAGLFAPLRERIEDGDILLLMAELGIEFPPALANDPAFGAALADVIALTSALPGQVTALTTALQADDTAAALSRTLEILQAVRELVTDTENVASAIEAKKNTFPGVTPAEVEAFAAALPQRLFDFLVVRWMETASPAAAAGLDFIGVFDRTDENVGSINPAKPPYVRRELDLGALTRFIGDPGGALKARYGWGTGGFDGRVLLQKLERLALELGLPALYTEAGTPTLDLLFLEVQPDPGGPVPGLRVRLHTVLKAADAVTLQGAGWRFDFSAGVSAPVETRLFLQPDGSYSIQPPPAVVIEGDAGATFRTLPPAGGGKFVLLGQPAASRLEFTEFSAGTEVGLTFDTGTGRATGDFSLGAEVRGGQLVVDLSKADGFIGKVLAVARFSAAFDFALGYSTETGFFFRGSSALEIQLPVHIDLAVVEIHSLTLSVGLGPQGVPVGIGADIKANLGPLQAVIENVGMKATFAFADDRDGNLGPVDLGFAFQPPNGVGLSIDAAIVKGGGYLFFDYANEEYAGALELAIAEIVTVKAIGLVTTRLPDGSKGFSLLIIITAEFQPIQLGFGFTLIGLGGLLGVNRTMRLDQLAEGVRTGAVESVLFPRDVVANAPRIISDLRRFFPPQDGVFVIGPMARLGWGTPTLVSLSLGVMIAIPPGNIAILGVLKVALPHEDAALLVLQVNFIGALEFDKKRVWFFASLFESRVLFITIEGEMGLLVAWGDDANFVVSVGGFHPTFNPPPLPFPSPRRVALSILNTSFARIRVEGYFAVTSNTAQFGSRVEMFFGLDAVNVQGHLGFDALFQFSPFYFIITISASLSVTVFGMGLFSVRFRGELSGTSPWHVEGEGSISILFFSIDIPFSHTWGEEAQTTLEPIQVMPLLTAELDKLANWTAAIPAGNRLLVSLRTPEPLQELVLHPLGTLRVSQRAVPLDFKLEKVGARVPSDVNQLRLEVADADLARRRDTKESFATAQYRKLSDAQKLATPAYEPQNGGMELSVTGDAYRSQVAVRRTVRYETEIIDTNFRRFVRRFFGLVSVLFEHLAGGSAASRSALSHKTLRQREPEDQKVSVAATVFVVASMTDNTVLGAAPAGFTSRVGAADFLAGHLRANPAQADELHVIPWTEARAA